MDKEKLEKTLPRLDEIPFQSEKQYMATLHPRDGGRVVYVKGSVERLLSLSKDIMKGDEIVPLTEGDVRAIMQANISMAGEAMRVIATAYTNLPPELEELRDENIRGNLVFVGLAGMNERATLLGGQLTVDSTPGAGVCVRAELPLGYRLERRVKERST